MSLNELLAIIACFGVGYWIVARLMTKPDGSSTFTESRGESGPQEGQQKTGHDVSDAKKGPGQ